MLSLALLALGASATPLDDYVNTPDPHYSWVDTGKTMSGKSPDGKHKWTGYVLNMTSQKWLTEAESSRPIWFHIMVVCIPDKLVFKDFGLLYITGGGNGGGGDIPSPTDEDMTVVSSFAMAAGLVTAVIFQIPNAPIVFPSDPTHKSRNEDAIIAFTWDHFVKYPDQPEWLLRLPMTKASVRALDTMAAWTKQKLGNSMDKFLVAGASKRGWTTWTVGAVDKRVVGIAPIVMDELNFVPNIHHHYRSYGGWSFALRDYYEMNFTVYIDSPQVKQMMDIIDPISYKDRYTYPKLVCNAGGDEFFLPDDTRWWWKEMPEPKNFLMVPNAEHSMATGILELLPAATAWALEVIQGRALPSLTWTIDPVSGDITAVTNKKPKAVHMWRSTTCNEKRRDFRLLNADKPCLCGVAAKGYCANLAVLWNSTELQPVKVENGTYTFVGHQTLVPNRWVAFFLDFVFDPPTQIDFRAARQKTRVGTHWPIDWGEGLEYTTEVSVVPNTFPYPDCTGQNCTGILV